MAILVNWFEVTFSRKDFELPYMDSDTWEESTKLRAQYPEAETVRTRLENNTIRIYFVTSTPSKDPATDIVPVYGPRGVLARIIEYNLAKHFEASGASVVSGQWGVEATQEVQHFPDIGLMISQGIHLQYFAVTQAKFRNGITLNWIIRPTFVLPLAKLPSDHAYDGYPVILRWPLSLGTCPEELAPFDQRYAGTIISRENLQAFQVLLRDRTVYEVSAEALFLEARTDVLNEMERIVTRTSGQPSIQRRILQLSHSLKSDGRRNPGILRDQLRSALSVLDPSDRGQMNIPLLPNCSGQLWVNCYATGAQRA
jgi:hypothetical protein